MRPRAIIPVDLYGLPADYAAIETVATKYGLSIVADAAQSFGARRLTPNRNSRPDIRDQLLPDEAARGFGDGGAIFTDDDQLAQAVREIRSHGTRGSGDVAMRLGLTGRLDTLQAAVLLVGLEVFEERLALCRQIAARYQQAFSGVVKTPPQSALLSSAWALYTIRTPDRDNVRARLAEVGV